MLNKLEILEWYVDAGVDVLLEDTPVNRFDESSSIQNQRTSQSDSAIARASQPAARAPQRQPAQAALPDADQVKTARELAQSASDLKALREVMENFDGCNLKRTAKSTVFADGEPSSRIMLIGEAPGRDEDLQGLPFVGRAGQLLDKMLAAINLDRTGAYITNIIPWRPPGNRTPTPQETEICRPFIERHIELIDPDLVVMLGGSSAKTLMNTTNGIMRLRGRWTEVATQTKKIVAMPTLHPAYLLRQPAHKNLAWRDFLEISERLKRDPKAI